MIDATHYGATPAEWTHFDAVLGLTADLLPVVANPNARISPGSSLQSLGKTPSQYSTGAQVYGIEKWTKRSTRRSSVDVWIEEPDYGICLQTRTVRAIDVDVADPVKAQAVADFIGSRLGFSLPRRGRSDSSKFLLAFRMPGDFKKRVVQLDDTNRIEFLATGQQFVAAGTHPSGARYEWQGGLPQGFPAMGPAKFEELWAALAEKFGRTAAPQASKSGSQWTPPGPHGLTLEDLQEMLQLVPGSTVRDYWLHVVWMLRSAWRESIDGSLDEAAVLQLADGFSRRGDTGKYQHVDDVRRKFKEGDDRAAARGYTWRSLLRLARQGGWQPNAMQRNRLNASAILDLDDVFSCEEVRKIYGVK